MNSPGPGGKKGNGSIPDGKKSSRQKRIERLKGKVEQGTYHVRLKELADKMVEDAVRRIRSRIRPE